MSAGRSLNTRFARSRPASSSPTERVERFLLNLVDLALAGSIFVVPMILGGTHGVGRLLLVTFASIAAVAWSLRQTLQHKASWKPTGAFLLFLGGLGILFLQLSPLSDELLQFFSPQITKLLPLWTHEATGAVRLGQWDCLSLVPTQTKAGIVIFLAYGLLFLVTLNRISKVEELERLLYCVGLATLLMAIFGLAQYLFSNGKFFWFYEHPYSSTISVVKGGFVNRNHFAHFLALGIGPLLWWIHKTFRESHAVSTSSKRKNARFSQTVPHSRTRSNDQFLDFLLSKTFLLGIGLGLVTIACLLSLSRGGNAAFFLSIACCVILFCLISRKGWKLGLSVLALGAVLLGTLSYFDETGKRVDQRLGDLTAGSSFVWDQLDARREIWSTVFKASEDFPWFGAGVGSHRYVYPAYLDAPTTPQLEYTHAENGYLQVLIETGATGTLLLLTGIGYCFTWCLRGIRQAKSSRLTFCLAAVFASLVASTVHSLCDFVWYMPGCMALTVILAAAACRGHLLALETNQTTPKNWTLSRQNNLLVFLAVTFVAIGMIAERIGPAFSQGDLDAFRRSIVGLNYLKEYPDPNSMSAKELDETIHTQQRRIEHLERVIRWEPENAEALENLARAHLVLFDLHQINAINPMSLLNVADAMQKSRGMFPSVQARNDWLDRAVGEHRRHLDLALVYSRRAIAACPLYGKAYVHLANLGFLNELAPAETMKLLHQATLVRPFDGSVLHLAANQAFLIGDVASWKDLAFRAFHADPKTQKQIIKSLVGATPNEHLETVINLLLDTFQPKVDGMIWILETSQNRATPQQLARLRNVLAENACAKAKNKDKDLSAKKTAQYWITASIQFTKLGQPKQALHCAEQAYKSLPSHLLTHAFYGRLLLEQQNYAEAKTHLRWCLRACPNNRKYKRFYQSAISGELNEKAQRDDTPTDRKPALR